MLYHNPVVDWQLDTYERSARVIESGLKRAVPRVTGVAAAAFVTVAEGRQYLQRRSFDFGYWYMKYVIPSAVERTDAYFCPSDAWGCWIPGMIVGTVGLAAGWSPLFATTLMAYTHPVTAAVAFPLDAYNIYSYFN